MNHQKEPTVETIEVSNADFINAVFCALPEQASAAVCSIEGDPTDCRWPAIPADRLAMPLPTTANNYLKCSSFRPDDEGRFRARKDNVAAVHFIMLDDLGTKVPFVLIGEFTPSWLIETSPGNYQAGIILDPPVTDVQQIDHLFNSIVRKGLCDAGATGPATRWARLPEGINGKPKYRTEHGEPFQCRLVHWDPEWRYTISEIVAGLELPTLASPKVVDIAGRKSVQQSRIISQDDGEYYASAGGTSLTQLKALLDAIDPDCGYGDWSRVLMAVYHETAGSDEGLALVDEWSSQGKKYKGIKELELKWASFSGGTSKPVTIGTLKYLAGAAGADVVAIMQGGDDGFDVCATVVIAAEASKQPEAKVEANPLVKFSVSQDLAELERQMVAEEPLLGNIALKGQATAIYAAPNTGKTLIVLHLIIDAVKKGRIDPQKLFYLNMDDNSNGLVDKTRLAAEYGFQMIAAGHKDFQVADFRKAMERMIATDTARGISIILDTVKKFTNTMDKTTTADFAKLIRQFSMKGGSVIALGHTNKNKGRDGKRQYSGTSDIVDDFDCAYIVDTLDETQDSGQKVVEFENIKRRGNVAQSIAYSYSTEAGISYEELLLSVGEFDDSRLFPLKKSIAIHSDISIIKALKTCISQGICSKMKLVDSAAKAASVSQRAVLAVLERYTGNDPSAHYWKFVVGGRGTKAYALLSTEEVVPA
jgi:hypothetical protein